MQTETNTHAESCKGYTARFLVKRARTGTRPGVHDLEKEIACMTAFLVLFGLAALLVVGGVRGSLRLRPHRLSTGRRLSGLRRSYATPMNYTTEDEVSRHYRKAWVTVILLLVVVMVIIINTLNAAVIH